MSRYNLGEKEATRDIWLQVSENCHRGTAMLMPRGGKYQVSYGFDHACGYFIQFFYIDEEDSEDEEQCINIDSIFDGLTGAELAFILQQLGCTNQEHIDMAYLDLEF